jgi:hypothetical protein
MLQPMHQMLPLIQPPIQEHVQLNAIVMEEAPMNVGMLEVDLIIIATSTQDQAMHAYVTI